MTRRARGFMLGVALAATLFPGTGVLAQTKDGYPNRALRLIVPNAPGGASDFTARIIQPHWADQFGQTVVIDNRGGAAGNIALETTARSTPDGYTLLIASNTQAINPSIYPNFLWKPLEHLIPITQVADIPGSLVVHPSMPVKTVKELIAYGKANPGKFNYGSPSPSSANRLAMETGTWMGIFVTKGTPNPIVKKIYDVSVKTMEHPDVTKRFAVAGTRAAVSRSPEEFRAFVKSETENYAIVIKEAGITAD